MRKLFLILLFCLIASSSFASDLFVNFNATGSNNGSSLTDGWESFSNINWTSVDGLTGGDRLWICGHATSTLTTGQTGEEGDPIIIDGDCSTQGGEDGSITASGNAANIGSWVTLRNMTLYGGDDVVNADGSTGAIVEYNTITSDGTSSSQSAGMRCQSCTNPIYRGNTFYGIGSGGQPDGVYIQYGSGALIERNYIEITSTSGSHVDCVQFNGSNGATIRYNYCYQNNTNSADRQGFYGTYMSGIVKVYGNVAYGPYMKQVLSMARYSYNATYYTYNNTIIGGPYNTDRLAWYHAQTGYSLTAYHFNNYCYTASTTSTCVDRDASNGSVTLYSDYNISYCPNDVDDCWDYGTFSSWQAQGQDLHSSHQDGLLDSNYRPTSSSPLIDAGNNLGSEYDDGLSIEMTTTAWISSFGTVDRDIEGGSGWNVGAFEYSTEGDTTPPNLSNLLPSGAQRCSDSEWPYTTFTLRVTTNETSTCKYATENIDYGSMTTFTTTGGTSHSESMTILCGESPQYYIKCSDGYDNISSASLLAFTIDKDPPPQKYYQVH